jgi:arylsulfatase A-like enzyme
MVDLWRDHAPARGEDGGEFAEYKYAREAVKIIRRHAHHHQEKPIFMYMAFQCAHSPDSADVYDQVYYEDTEETYTKDFADYNGMVTIIDSAIGNITRALKKNNFMWSNSLFVFTSDNGGPTAMAVSGHSGNNFPLRGGKFTVWEGGVRVPAFIAGGLVPKSLHGSKRSGHMHIADWWATFAGLAGYDPSDDKEGLPPVDSIDMWKYLMGEEHNSPRREVPLCSGQSNYLAKGGGYVAKGGGATLRRGRVSSLAAPAPAPDMDEGSGRAPAALIIDEFKLVRFQQGYCFHTGPLYPNTSTTHLNEEKCDCGRHGCLYNVYHDPGERYDLAHKLPKEAARLRARAEEIDRTGIDYIKEEGWRGKVDGYKMCEAAKHFWGGFWGPINISNYEHLADADAQTDVLQASEELGFQGWRSQGKIGPVNRVLYPD